MERKADDLFHPPNDVLVAYPAQPEWVGGQVASMSDPGAHSSGQRASENKKVYYSASWAKKA